MLIVKVPGINGLGKTKGCENSGNAILEKLDEIYSNEQGKIIDKKLLDLEEIHLDNSNLQISNELIYKNTLQILECQDKVIFLGGDHSISYSIGRAFLKYTENQGKEPCLIVFDAHADCMPVTGNSSAVSFPTHEEWLRGLIEQGFPAENILLVGIRNIDAEEIRFLKEKNIKVVSMSQLNENLEETCDIIMEFAQGNRKNKELYLSLDIDVVDPSFAPATGYKEPGGLTSRQFIYVLQRLNKLKNLKVVDIVEINSEKDKKIGFNNTVKLGAKILSELI